MFSSHSPLSKFSYHFGITESAIKYVQEYLRLTFPHPTERFLIKKKKTSFLLVFWYLLLAFGSCFWGGCKEQQLPLHLKLVDAKLSKSSLCFGEEEIFQSLL